MAGPIPADAVSPPPPRRLRRYILGALAAALVLAAGYCFGYEPPYRGTLIERPPRPLIFAHRGFGDHGPDNSLYAVEHALRAGMDGVDMDGQLTRDSELVIFHDLSVDRLTSGVGRVRDKTRRTSLKNLADDRREILVTLDLHVDVHRRSLKNNTSIGGRPPHVVRS